MQRRALTPATTGDNIMACRYIISAFATAATLLAATPAFADAPLIVQGADGLESSIQVRNGRGRLNSSGMSGYLVFDTTSGSITFVEPAQRRYTQATAAELQSSIEAAASIRESVAPYMADLLAGLPAEQRRMIEQRMGGLPGAPAAGQSTGTAQIATVARGTHTIAGLRCHASGILKNGRPAAEVCMATAPSGKLSAADFATLAQMVSVARTLAAGAGSMLGNVADQLEFLATDVDGVPVAVRDLEHGKRYQVSAVSNAPLQDALFNSYGGFRKQQLAGLLGQ
jgi:hypothetical protein